MLFGLSMGQGGGGDVGEGRLAGVIARVPAENVLDSPRPTSAPFVALLVMSVFGGDRNLMRYGLPLGPEPTSRMSEEESQEPVSSVDNLRTVARGEAAAQGRPVRNPGT